MEGYFSGFFYSSPHENGFLTFVLGIVFVLTVYHFILYFQHKNRTYVYYSTYTFLVLITYSSITQNDFLDKLTTPIQPFFKLTHLVWVWLYNIAYFFFVFRFLNFNLHFKYQAKKIKKVLYVLMFIDLICLLITMYQNNFQYLTLGYTYVFLPVIITLTLYCFYLIYKVPEQTKFYILLGSFVLFISSVVATLSVDFGLIFTSKETGYLIFYIGLIIENIFFSLGLGLRQKLIINERDQANQELITKLQENEKLKEEANKQLQEKVNVLSDKIHLKKEIEDLKLSALRSQMNPHFIFNALNSIKLYIINNEQKNAATYLNKFSKLMRKILEASAVKETTLKEEIETSSLYMSIENMRFSNEIDFQIKINNNIELACIKIPPLVLQPFLENALWHGLASKKGDKKITLSLEKISNKFVQISIEDNGIGRKEAEKIKAQKSIKRKSVGIDLTKKRLKKFVKGFENNYSLNYKDLIDENRKVIGTKVILKLPLV